MWSGVPYEPFITINQDQLSACAAEIGATIVAEAFPSDQFFTSVLQAGSSGDLPDLLMVSSGNFPEYAAAGIFSDLEALGLDPAGLSEAVAESGYIDGTLYGISSHAEVAALQYNPEILAEAGVEVPTTFEELREVAAELTSDGYYGIALPGTSGGGAGSFFLLSFILGAGGDPSDFTDPGTIAAIQLYQDLVEDGSMSSEMVTWDWDFQDQFNGGLAAITINGPWAAAPSDDPDFVPRSFALTPTYDGNAPRSGMTSFPWAVSETGDETRKAAAAAVLECRLAAENQVEMAEAQFYIPANEEAAADWAADNPDVEPFVELLPTAFDQGGQLGEEWFQINTQLASAIQYAVVGGMSAEDALAQAASE